MERSSGSLEEKGENPEKLCGAHAEEKVAPSEKRLEELDGLADLDGVVSAGGAVGAADHVAELGRQDPSEGDEHEQDDDELDQGQAAESFAVHWDGLLEDRITKSGGY